jgi:hypothetical protein
MEYYSAMKKNKIMSLAGKWIEPESIMLSKPGSKRGRMFSLICGR